jgi:hypothetical protein
LYEVVVKSLREAQPLLGLARAPVELQEYLEGRAQAASLPTAEARRTERTLVRCMVLVERV